jgi:hypothetical protein
MIGGYSIGAEEQSPKMRGERESVVSACVSRPCASAGQRRVGYSVECVATVDIKVTTVTG